MGLEDTTHPTKLDRPEDRMNPPPVAPLKPKPKPPAPRDAVREFLETAAFVVALVLMLKLFVVEAFVIPTGSMAETLYGYQKNATCPQCGFHFPVNCSDEASPQDGVPKPVVGGTCPNCRYTITWGANGPDRQSGDRVLVHKALFHFEPPTRGDVVVFKYPVDPQLRHEAQNYIKRLCGLGGETIAINRGDLFRSTALTYPPGPVYPRPDDPRELWEGPETRLQSRTNPSFKGTGTDYTYHRAEEAVALFDSSREAGFGPAATGFEPIRKPDPTLLAVRRIVFDNDHQSKTLAEKGVPPRWAAEAGGWAADTPQTPRSFSHTGAGLDWVRYRHLAPRSEQVWDQVAQGGYNPAVLPPGVVTNNLGYNSGRNYAFAPLPGGAGGRPPILAPRVGPEYWVGDLMLECEATFADADSELVLELSKGPHRYQAWFAGGRVRLLRVGPQGRELAAAPSPVGKPGKYALRFSNVDCELRVWVDGRRVEVGAGGEYPPDPVPKEFDPEDAMEEGWAAANDKAAPASVGAKGGAGVRKLVLWRDSYYTYANAPAGGVARFADTLYVHPGHNLCLGDNSAQSSDSRKWGLVPDRLLLGKAVFVFFPVNRVGFIK